MYPVSPGHPNYSASGTNKFIPEIWSGKLLVKFYDATVFAAIANTDYEGEIKNYGDKVIIRTTPTITIRPYVIGQNLQTERPESPATDLLIDKGNYYQFVCDDVVAHQTDLTLMNNWSQDASEQQALYVDSDILTNIWGQAHALNKGLTAGKRSGDINLGVAGTPLQVTKENIIDVIVDMSLVLSEQSVPKSDRYLVVPEWFGAMLKKSDLKDASMTGDGKSILRNGRIGMIDFFEIYLSNNLAAASDGGHTCFKCYFGQKSALTFASQFVKTETLRGESTFGDLVRGLQVYGYKVLKTEALGELYIYK
jgi:hypothetical protein